jgi:rRNA pseudouridine-1189 N-methylase Emg1 (Nep1/Mra1 family)
MAKKSFKGGLGSLLESTVRKSDEENLAEAEAMSISDLTEELRLAKEELYLWRTGKLSVKSFAESLDKCSLRYNEQTNRVEKKNPI